MRYIESIREGIEKVIIDKNAFIIGEDVQEPYGGAFKVTKGLSLKYPKNIIATPMTEQGFAAMGIGMALYGCYVSVEIMFGDFVTLIADQVINHAAKFRELYGIDLHIVFRTPSGGYRGYGATHSQSLEKLFLGIPGVQVVAPSLIYDPCRLFSTCMESGKPTIFIENKLDYPREIITEIQEPYFMETSEGTYPIVRIAPSGEKPDVTIVTYGGMVTMALEVMRHMLYEEEIDVEIIVMSNITDLSHVEEFVRTDKVVAVEEGVSNFGWGAEVCAHIAGKKNIKFKRIGAFDRVIPAAQAAENAVLPSGSQIIKAIYEVIG